MDEETMVVPLFLPRIDVDTAADAMETAVARLDAADRVEWVSAAADAFREELAGLRARAVSLRGWVDDADEAWRTLEWQASQAGQW